MSQGKLESRCDARKGKPVRSIIFIESGMLRNASAEWRYTCDYSSDVSYALLQYLLHRWARYPNLYTDKGLLQNAQPLKAERVQTGSP